MFIRFVKDMQVAIISPSATLFAQNSIRYAFRLLCNNVSLLRNKFHETLMIFRANINDFWCDDFVVETTST